MREATTGGYTVSLGAQWLTILDRFVLILKVITILFILLRIIQYNLQCNNIYSTPHIHYNTCIS